MLKIWTDSLLGEQELDAVASPDFREQNMRDSAKLVDDTIIDEPRDLRTHAQSQTMAMVGVPVSSSDTSWFTITIRFLSYGVCLTRLLTIIRTPGSPTSNPSFVASQYPLDPCQFVKVLYTLPEALFPLPQESPHRLPRIHNPFADPKIQHADLVSAISMQLPVSARPEEARRIVEAQMPTLLEAPMFVVAWV